MTTQEQLERIKLIVAAACIGTTDLEMTQDILEDLNETGEETLEPFREIWEDIFKD